MLFCCNSAINILTTIPAVDPPTLDATRRCLENAEGILREAEERGTYMSVEECNELFQLSFSCTPSYPPSASVCILE